MIVNHLNFIQKDVFPFMDLPSKVTVHVAKYVLDDVQSLCAAYKTGSFFKACIDVEIASRVRSLSLLINHLKNVSFDLSSGDRIELISNKSLNDVIFLIDQKLRIANFSLKKFMLVSSDIADLVIRSLIGTHFPQFIEKKSGSEYLEKCIEVIQFKGVEFNQTSRIQEIFLKICSGLELMRLGIHDSDFSLEYEGLNSLPYTKSAIYFRPHSRGESAVSAFMCDLSEAFDVDAHLLVHPIEALIERMGEVCKPIKFYEVFFDDLTRFHGKESIKEIANKVIFDHPKSQNNFKKAVKNKLI